MGMTVRYVEADKRTGRLSFRRVYPPRLRPYVPGATRELKRSLGAKSMRDPDALRTYAEAQAEYERVASLAEKAASGTYDPLDAATVSYLAEAFRTEALESDEAARWDSEERALYASLAETQGIDGQFAGVEGSRWAQKRREMLDASVAQSRSLLGSGDLDGIVELWGWEADQFAFSRGLRIDTKTPQFAGLCRALCRAALDAAEVGLARLDGEQVATPASPQRPYAATATRQPEGVDSPNSGETMGTLFEHLVTSKADPVSANTRQSWATAVRFWREVHLDMPCERITRRNVSEWLHLLAQRPTGIPKREETVDLPTLVERYRDGDVARLAPRTTLKHLVSLSAIWNKSEAAGYVEGANPFARHKVRVERKPGGSPFTLDELQRMLALPVFTEGKRPTRGRGEAVYWIPLFALFTGARPNEIAQLLVSDFEAGEDGSWWMAYTSDGVHPASGPRRLKTDIHGSGARQFRVPRQLIELGLPRYLEWLKGKGEVALFPKLTASTKGLHEAFSRFWGPYLREHGVIGEGKRQVREFRHNWATAARASGIPEAAISYLMGHKAPLGTVTGSYGAHSPHASEMAKLEYAGLDLSCVRRWEAPRYD